MLTRRWFCLVTSSGEITWLVSSIESAQFTEVPGEIKKFGSWTELVSQLASLLSGLDLVAMEVSPDGMIPYISRVDSGTIALVESSGIEVISSGDLVQWCQSRWSDEAYKNHLTAVKHLYEVKDETLAFIANAISTDAQITEYGVQQMMTERFEELDLIYNHPPIVAVGAHAGDPHYTPDSLDSVQIRRDDLILIDMWAKTRDSGAVYGDITWMAYSGEKVTDRYAEIFAVIAQARDAALSAIIDVAANGEDLSGFAADDAARSVITEAGYGDAFIHRTGHSIGVDDHGTGANLDNLESHDTRRLIPGLGFSIEPGIYLPDCGFRTDINVFRTETGVEVTTQPVQQETTPLLA